MAKQRNMLQFSGRLGNVIGRRNALGRSGEYVVSPYDPEAYFRTPTQNQIVSQAKLTLAAKLAAMLGILGQQALVANGTPANHRASLVSLLYSHITLTANNTPAVSASLDIIRQPKASINFANRTATFNAPTAQASGSLAYSFEAQLNEDDNLVRLVTALLLYDKDNNRWRSTTAVSTSPNTSVRLYVDNSWADTNVIAYAYTLGIVRDPNASSLSIGNLVGDPDQIVQNLSPDAVIIGGIRFTQIDSFSTEGIFHRP